MNHRQQTEFRGPDVRSTTNIRWFFLFFFISGFCSLVYEVVWLRLSMAKFGVTTPGVSIVLSVFMAGLGIGSWAGGWFVRRFDRSPAVSALRLYAIVELIIGISGLIVPAMLDIGYVLLRDSARGLAWGSSSYYLVSGGVVAICLLPWCTCMGATFPFAMAAIRSLRGGKAQHSFSYLYLANVLGAVLGTLVPAFILVEIFGFKGTLRIATTLNVLLAGAVFAVSTRISPASAKAPAKPSAPTQPVSGSSGILWQLFATGLCSMAMEVVWTREFTVYLGNVVYAFASILAIYLLATFLGSAMYRRRVNSLQPQIGATAWIPLGLLSLLPLLFADPRLPGPSISEMGDVSFGYAALRVAFGIAPFSALVGFLTPMLVDRWSSGDPQRAGRAYAMNVLGSILGPVLGGFCVLPWAGERGGLLLISLPLFAIGLASALRLRERGPLPRFDSRYLYAAMLVASTALFAGTKGYGTRYPERVELRDYTANVIATGTGMHKRLLVNGMGMTILTPITKVMAHLPLTMLGHPAKKALVICFGMGTSFRSMLSWDLDTTTVELVPSVPKLFGFYHANGPELLKSPHARLVIDDGRRFLERSSDKFDVIVVDPPPPTSAPTSGLLYSPQFYDVIKPHMAPGGILQMWFPSGGDYTTMVAVAKAIQNSFPYVRAYVSIGQAGLHFLARMEPFADETGDQLAQRLPAKAAADLIEWNEDDTPAEMFDAVLEGRRTIPALIELAPNAPPLSDDRPINEYFLLRSASLKSH